MELATTAKDKIEDALNAEGRSFRHVATGILVCVSAVALTAILSARQTPQQTDNAPIPLTEQRPSAAKALWPALFSLTTLAALRIWNAPPSPARNRALGLWAGLQGVNAIWMALGPRSKAGGTAAALSTAAMTAAYAQAAARVDAKTAGMVTPPVWANLASLFTPRDPLRTVH
jgi:benzodiazapine receptor